MFIDSHGVEQDVMLRTKAEVFPDIHHVLSQIKSINVRRSSARWQKTCAKHGVQLK